MNEKPTQSQIRIYKEALEILKSDKKIRLQINGKKCDKNITLKIVLTADLNKRYEELCQRRNIDFVYFKTFMRGSLMRGNDNVIDWSGEYRIEKKSNVKWSDIRNKILFEHNWDMRGQINIQIID